MRNRKWVTMSFVIITCMSCLTAVLLSSVAVKKYQSAAEAIEPLRGAVAKDLHTIQAPQPTLARTELFSNVLPTDGEHILSVGLDQYIPTLRPNSYLVIYEAQDALYAVLYNSDLNRSYIVGEFVQLASNMPIVTTTFSVTSQDYLLSFIRSETKGQYQRGMLTSWYGSNEFHQVGVKPYAIAEDTYLYIPPTNHNTLTRVFLYDCEGIYSSDQTDPENVELGCNTPVDWEYVPSEHSVSVPLSFLAKE